MKRQHDERTKVGLRELAEAVTSTRVRHEAARRDADEALAALTCAERAAADIPCLVRARSAQSAVDAVQSRLDIANNALTLAVAQLATEEASVAQIDRDAAATSVEAVAAAAALLVAEKDMLVATDVVAGFDLVTRELADFRGIGTAQIAVAFLERQKRNDAAEREHAELTAAAKQPVSSLSFRDYLQFGLTL